MAEKHARTDKSNTKMDTEGGREVGTSQSHSRQKKGHMTNIYLTDSDEEAVTDFVKNHEELYDKTNLHFKDKARKKCFGGVLPTAASCLSKCARLGSNPIGLNVAYSPD